MSPIIADRQVTRISDFIADKKKMPIRHVLVERKEAPVNSIIPGDNEVKRRLIQLDAASRGSGESAPTPPPAVQDTAPNSGERRSLVESLLPLAQSAAGTDNGRDNNFAGYMGAGFSIALIVAGLFVILSGKYAPIDKHWAYATIGTIVGHWLK